VTIPYRWRLLTDDQKADLLAWRKVQHYPWHSPKHRVGYTLEYHLTAACYEHRPHIGYSLERMQRFCETLLETLRQGESEVHAWCVLPNHYHALVFSPNILFTLAALGQMHGRSSHNWNMEEELRGRKVWYRCVERNMRNERHRWATVNYIHHNPVHHGYVKHWQDWPFGSAQEFLEQMGREKVKQIWQTYPILDYGKGWDDPRL
jgi:putative transposase